MTPEQTNLARAFGKAWAEIKADALRGQLPAVDWPEVWEPEWAGAWPFRPTEISERERPGLIAVATHAAAERWRELLIEQRASEDAGDEEHEGEAQALRLLSVVEPSLPQGLAVDHDGPRVFLTDDQGVERTVDSIEHAWRVIAEYEERRSLRTS